jgi:hypothetical protein
MSSDYIINFLLTQRKVVGRSCQLHHRSGGMLLVVEPSTHSCVAWLLIVLSSIDVGGVPAIHPIYTGPGINL